MQFTETTCPITASTPGDGADNDCDGLSDEDTCYTGYGVYSEGEFHRLWCVDGNLSTMVTGCTRKRSYTGHAVYPVGEGHRPQGLPGR